MSEHLKLIVQTLNKDPHNKNFNIISFDSLEPLQLLQVVNDVLAVIDLKNKIDIREESIEQTCVRMLEILQILRYKPATDQNNLSNMMQGLVVGDKLIVYPLLSWLLERVPELSKRAYLSRFMVLIQVPTEFLQDEEVARLYEQYEEIIQKFKETHKELESIRSSGVSTSDVKKDINTMQNEKEQLIKRVERQRRKVESFPNSEPMLEIARKLRSERDKENKVQHQIQEQKAVLLTLEQKVRRVNQQLKEMRQVGASATPDSLVQRQEEEVRFNQLMVTEKMPKEIAKTEKFIQDLEHVVSQPAMSQADLDIVSTKIKAVNSEINRVTEARMMSINTKEDKLIMFRQQASIVARKKDNAVEKLRESREAVTRTETELEEKRSQLAASAVVPGPGGSVSTETHHQPVLRGDEFKRFVAQLRTKSNLYKPRRQALGELKAEQGVLARTRELLSIQDERMRGQLGRVEASKGASGFWTAQDNLEKVSEQMSELNAKKGGTLEEMAVLVGRLTSSINQKKSDLVPILAALKPLRQRSQELQHEHDDKKAAYDSVHAGAEVSRAQVEHEVRALKEELRALEGRFHQAGAAAGLLRAGQARLQEEMRAYLAPQEVANGDKKRSCRDAYTKKISEQEALAKSLRERQKAVREAHGPNLRQRQLWADLESLLACKSRCRKADLAREMAGGVYADVQRLEENRLIL